jgi:hypothetical protein
LYGASPGLERGWCMINGRGIDDDGDTEGDDLDFFREAFRQR